MNVRQFNILHYATAFACAGLWAWAVTHEKFRTMPDPATMPFVHRPSEEERST